MTGGGTGAGGASSRVPLLRRGGRASAGLEAERGRPAGFADPPGGGTGLTAGAGERGLSATTIVAVICAVLPA